VAVTWAMELLLTGMGPTAMGRHLHLRADARASRRLIAPSHYPTSTADGAVKMP
jgi:hypothetical protein